MSDMEAGRELDALVARLMGRPPEKVWIVTNDGGASAVAYTASPGGTWTTRGDLEKWLAREQADGRHLGYEIASWDRYPKYSTDIADAWQAVESIYQRHPDWRFSLERDQPTPGWAAFWHTSEEGWVVHGFAEGDTAPLAICLAALKALEDTTP